jgi:hypothetical protein
MASSIGVAVLTRFLPSPPFAGPIHLGPRAGLLAMGICPKDGHSAVGHLLSIARPRAGAAGAGWMNGEQPDKLSEGAKPPSFCPAGIHLCGGGNPAPQGKTAGDHGV